MGEIKNYEEFQKFFNFKFNLEETEKFIKKQSIETEDNPL